MTTAGRIISSVVIFAGVSLFAGISGLVASAVLSPRADEQQKATDTNRQKGEQLSRQLGDLHTEVTSLREEIHQLKTLLAESRSKP